MRRKLLLLNLLLLATVALFARILRERWLEEKGHEKTVLTVKVPPVPAPRLPPVPTAPPILADRYADVAQKMLFSKDRNSTVIVDPVPPPKEPPVPPFPVAHGVMVWPGVPSSIILSEKPKSEQRSYHVGDKVGEFTIADISSETLVLEWDGKTFEKNIKDLEDKTPPAQAASAAPHPPPPSESAAAPESNLQQEPTNGPGAQISATERACTSGDTNPAGAVVEGYRKSVTQTPMGKSCGWEKVSQ